MLHETGFSILWGVRRFICLGGAHTAADFCSSGRLIDGATDGAVSWLHLLEKPHTALFPK